MVKIETEYICGDVSGDLSPTQYAHEDLDDDMVLLESAEGAWREAWVIDSTNGCLMSLEGLADHRGESVEELRSQLREVVAGEAAYDGDDAAYDGDDAVDDAGGAAYDGVDIGVDTMSTDELDADLDQGTVRKTVRKLDRGAVAAIREVIGADTDSEAVRKAVLLAKDVLVRD